MFTHSLPAYPPPLPCRYLLRAEQLALQSVSAFPLAALAWVLAFASLIAAVMGALGGEGGYTRCHPAYCTLHLHT
jgi:hypothetical protein